MEKLTMTYPFYPIPAQRSTEGTVPLPAFNRSRQRDPAGYLPDKGLIDAVNVALLLGQPLLLTGEPGTGKTELARHLAHTLGLGEPLKFETKSNSTARDLFYTYDAVGHFRAGQAGAAGSALSYLRWNALGEAILQSREKAEIERWLTAGFEHTGARRSVVLIDEIDKAPRDFPNDLLNEVEHLYFRVPELGNEKFDANLAHRPILVLTSNSEKHLPEAFLRRCIYYDIEFPTGERLSEIVMRRVGGVADEKAPLMVEGIALFEHLRHSGLRKAPATAELIDWLTALHQMGARLDQPLRAQADKLEQSLGALIKNKEDQEVTKTVVKEWMNRS
jgi:MoxR-like ATPase